MIRIITAIIFSLSFHIAVASPVWKITKNDHVFYLAGTVHILAESDYPLPAAFEKAYLQSDITVFEADLQAMSRPSAQQRMLHGVLYEQGSSLYDNLSSNTVAVLDHYLMARGINKNIVSRYKPGMVAAFLSINEMQRLGIAAKGVDAYFSQRALQDGKQQLALESMDEQIAFIADMANGSEDRFIRYTLADMNRIEWIMADLKKAWAQGDDEYLNKVFVESLKQDFPQIYQTLLVERNERWLAQFERYVQTEQTEMVLVGAAHMVGEDGLIQRLRETGYHVQSAF